jgi:AcrR family transcriptional regulator
MTPLPNRRTTKSNLDERILATAWEQIAQEGAGALSLRAIARALNIAAPSIYNYFPDRDALVTAMIVAAFSSLADAQEAVNPVGSADTAETRLTALGMAYRDWAISHPQHYQLIFGTPIPYYTAPEDLTRPAAVRALNPLVQVLQELEQSGALRTERLAPMSPKLAAMLEAWKDYQGGSAIEALYLALIIWSRMHGLVGLEVGNQLPGFLEDPAELYQREIANIMRHYL